MKKEKTNPVLYAAYMEVVENQLRDNDPPETRTTCERLKSEGFSELDAKKLIAQAIVAETFWIMKKKENFNLNRFVKNLNRLPAEPKEN
jgi:ribosomal protein S7